MRLSLQQSLSLPLAVALVNGTNNIFRVEQDKHSFIVVIRRGDRSINSWHLNDQKVQMTQCKTMTYRGGFLWFSQKRIMSILRELREGSPLSPSEQWTVKIWCLKLLLPVCPQPEECVAPRGRRKIWKEFQPLMSNDPWIKPTSKPTRPLYPLST